MASASLPHGRLALKYGRETVRITRSPSVLGRGEDCEIRVLSGLVSRRHAELTLSAEGLMIEDLGSRNGVLVNSEVIAGPRRLEAGDTIVLGDQTLEVIELAPVRSKTLPEIGGGDTLVNVTALSPADITHQGNVFDLLANVVDKQLALGHGAEAEKLLHAHLTRTLDGVRGGAKMSPSCEKAAAYALKLAGATGKPEWIEYAFTLYATLQAFLPRDLIDELYTLLRKVPGVPARTIRNYAAQLQETRRSLSPADRFLLQRIQGLEQLLG